MSVLFRFPTVGLSTPPALRGTSATHAAIGGVSGGVHKSGGILPGRRETRKVRWLSQRPIEEGSHLFSCDRSHRAEARIPASQRDPRLGNGIDVGFVDRSSVI